MSKTESKAGPRRDRPSLGRLRGVGVALAVMSLACLSNGLCRAQPPGPASHPVYERAATNFADAHYFKPAEAAPGADLYFTLAPLLIQRAAGGSAVPAGPDLFGTLVYSNAQLVVDRSQPCIYAEADTVTIGGRAHARIAYSWFYPAGSNGAPGVVAQGVRMVLNNSGYPVVWETLADTSGLRLLYVAESLEKAARTNHGAVLPGRRFAVETSTNNAPGALVARVIDDGPVPMGPTLYLDGASRNVSTLICRCMPAQAANLLTTTVYRLVRPGSTAEASLLYDARARSSASRFSDQPLEKLLRLPDVW